MIAEKRKLFFSFLSGCSVIIQLDYQLRPGSGLCKTGFVSKLCRCYAVRPVFVSLVNGVTRTNLYWQQCHGHDLSLYSLASRAFGFLAFSGKHLAFQPSIQNTSVCMCISCCLHVQLMLTHLLMSCVCCMVAIMLAPLSRTLTSKDMSSQRHVDILPSHGCWLSL